MVARLIMPVGYDEVAERRCVRVSRRRRIRFFRLQSQGRAAGSAGGWVGGQAVESGGEQTAPRVLVDVEVVELYAR